MSESDRIDEIDDTTTLPALLRSVYSIWNDLPKQPALPLFQDFSLENVPHAILPWSIIVDVSEDRSDFRFRFWGTERTNLIGKEMSGKFLSDIEDETMREGNRAEYDVVCARAKPLICNTPIVVSSGVTTYRVSIRLPLSSDGTTVSHIYSTIDPDTVTEEHYQLYGTRPTRFMK